MFLSLSLVCRKAFFVQTSTCTTILWKNTQPAFFPVAKKYLYVGFSKHQLNNFRFDRKITIKQIATK